MYRPYNIKPAASRLYGTHRPTDTVRYRSAGVDANVDNRPMCWHDGSSDDDRAWTGDLLRGRSADSLLVLRALSRPFSRVSQHRTGQRDDVARRFDLPLLDYSGRLDAAEFDRG